MTTWTTATQLWESHEESREISFNRERNVISEKRRFNFPVLDLT